MNSSSFYQQPQGTTKINPHLAVSIILPVDSLMSNSQLQRTLQVIVEKIEVRLVSLYSENKTAPIINKLKRLIQKFNYKRHKKAIAIFVSPFVEEIYYLKAEVEEKIVIDEFFETGDEVFKKQTNLTL